MKYIITYLSFILIAGFIAAGCSEIKKDLPVQPSTQASVAHGEGFAQFGHPNFHGTFLKKNNWDIRPCQNCHTGYNAGNTGVSCRKCHTQPAGPEACNTCHGDFMDPNFIAPPEDTKDSSKTSMRGVGAHRSHLYENEISNQLACSECHTVPTSVWQEGHITGTPAPVHFGTFTTTKSPTTPTYNPSDNPTCSNVYCHGNFSFPKSGAAPKDTIMFSANQMVGNNTTPVWTNLMITNATSQTQKCGSCHDLPPKGHLGHGVFPVSSCGGSGCHFGIVDDNGNIIDKSKHINGAVNVHGN